MIEMLFGMRTQAATLGIKVVGQNILIKGNMSKNRWIDMRDLSSKEHKDLKSKHGSSWFNQYLEASDLRKNMNEIEIAHDLKKDLEKSGWRLWRIIE